MSGTFFHSIECSAAVRNLEFNITKEYIWNLFLQQERKCAFTGEILVFSSHSYISNGTASLDRIDSSKGYIEGNVQWVHKDINVAKQDKTDTDFIQLCRRVVDYQDSLRHKIEKAQPEDCAFI